MIENKDRVLTKATLLAASTVSILYFVVRHRAKIFEKFRFVIGKRNPWQNQRIEVVETVDDCERVIEDLKRHCKNYKVLGFDCEWVTVGGIRRPIALLQLSSNQGLCALFRLCTIKHIPKVLSELLEDDEIIKVGVGPQDDAMKLSYDYGVGVASTLDLRFVAVLTNNKPEGLAKMSKNFLDVHLDKHWRLVCSDWEASVLSAQQLQYAAKDALVAVKLFEKLSNEMNPRKFWHFFNPGMKAIQMQLEPFFDMNFKGRVFSNTEWSKHNKSRTVNKTQLKQNNQQIRNMSTQSKKIYDNCLLVAPDDELLCTIDRGKAEWYLGQKLGELVNNNPFTVRLNFEPAGRAVGDVGRFYQTPKENQCTVCGRKDAYIRKNVVPREYRRHFPDVMKSHTSHDVLLLCPPCHQLSNISDLSVRKKLATKCNAPITRTDGDIKFIEMPEMKKIKSAGRALLINGHKIPSERRAQLEQIVLNHFTDYHSVTQELLELAANIETTLENENYSQHGAKVVEQYQTQTEFGGLVELEILWRKHFLHTMQPKFLPSLWNVNHTADRLQIRVNEGRINEEDLKLVGLHQLPISLEAK